MSTYQGHSVGSDDSANLFQNLLSEDGQERFDTILNHRGIRIERIVSHGRASDPAFWYDQHWDEWVLVVKGSAVLRLIDPHEGAPGQVNEVVLNAGDHLLIPAHVRHRVESTCADEPTVWLAIHWET